MGTSLGLQSLAMIVVVLALLAGSWTASAQGSADDFAALLDQIEVFNQMSPMQQNAVLYAAGLAIQSKANLDCNIFGGKPACKATPPQSSYAQQCGPLAEKSVDCLTAMEVANGNYDSPVDDLQQYIASTQGTQIAAHCPQCFERVQALWCALAVPTCGTFSKVVQAGVLPILAKAVHAYRSTATATRADAVASVMAPLLDVTSVGLPCRDMCEAMQDTCGCATSNETLGSLITWVAGQKQLAASGLPTVAYGRVLFKNVWDRSFCSLFPTRQSLPTGARCDPAPPVQCASRSQWCRETDPAHSNVMRYIQAILLLQLLRATTGWLTSDNAILFHIHSSVSDATHPSGSGGGTYFPHDGGSDDEWAGSRSSHSMTGGQVAGIVVLAVLLAACAAVGAFTAYRWMRAKLAANKNRYFELSSTEENEPFVSLPGGAPGGSEDRFVSLPEH